MPFIVQEARDSKVKCGCIWLVVSVGAHNFHIECGSWGGTIYTYLYTCIHMYRHMYRLTVSGSLKVYVRMYLYMNCTAYII